jgi:hypothetical protein
VSLYSRALHPNFYRHPNSHTWPLPIRIHPDCMSCFLSPQDMKGSLSRCNSHPTDAIFWMLSRNGSNMAVVRIATNTWVASKALEEPNKLQMVWISGSRIRTHPVFVLTKNYAIKARQLHLQTRSSRSRPAFNNNSAPLDSFVPQETARDNKATVLRLANAVDLS